MRQTLEGLSKAIYRPGTLLAVTVVLGLIASAWFGLVAAKGPESQEPWPPLVLEYRQEWYPEGPDGPLADETYRLEYQSKRSWRLELVASSYRPDSVGEWSSYDGEFFRTYSPATGLLDEIPNGGWVVPNDWLVPGMEDWITVKGFRRSPDPARPELRRYIKREPFPCDALQGRCPTGKSALTLTTEITFGTDVGIPMELTERLEDFIVRRITVMHVEIRE